MSPQDLKTIISSGLLSFPVTDFDARGNFRPDTYAARLEWLAPYGASALFAAGGTGEFFSLTGDEYPAIIRTAMDFCRAVANDDQATQHRLLQDFFMPYLAIRNRMQGYAVSIVKAGARIVGHDAGPVRPPLTDLKPAEVEQLAARIQPLGAQ